MPTCTPVYGFTYAVCSDAPCDIGDTFCAFAGQVDTELDRLDQVVNRVVDTVPQFEVAMGAYTFIGSNRNVAFDTINVDTDGMVDLDTDPFSFPVNTPGRWFLYFRVATNGDTAVQANIPVSVVNVPSLGALTISVSYPDDGTSYPALIDGSGFHRYPTAGTRVRLSVNTAALSIVSATFGGYWMGDL